jgi:chemotaxis protein methyltransferase CheR
VTPQDYDFVRKLLKDRSGLVLGYDKQYLLESRLMPVARKHGFAHLNDLIAALKVAPSSALATVVVEAMTTNESLFFRDKLPFDNFRDLVMPAMLKARAGSKKIRIWCSAAATGQEPYSLAMILQDMGAQLNGWRIEIVATDLSSQALTKAKAGLFSQFEVQRGLPIQMLVKYFTQVRDQWQITELIRSMVTFRHFNLLNDFGNFGQFDVVFCRNVLIYFDPQAKSSVLDRLGRVVARDGYLLLGAAETVVGLTSYFKPMAGQRGIYVTTSGALAPLKAVAAAG